MSDFRRMVSSRLMSVGVVILLVAAHAYAQGPETLVGYRLPTKKRQLAPHDLARVDAAKTVAVLATSTPFMRKEGGGVMVTYRGGRVGPEKAKGDVMKVLAEWGRFTVVDDPASADLVFAIQEETLGPSFMSDGKPRLKATMAVYPTGGPGVATPLWVAIDTENALAAASGLTRPDSEGIVERFRRDVENAQRSRER